MVKISFHIAVTVNDIGNIAHNLYHFPTKPPLPTMLAVPGEDGMCLPWVLLLSCTIQ